MAGEQELRAIIAPVLDARAIDLEDINVRRIGKRTLVNVVIDRDGGIDLDTVAEISQELSRAFDANDAVLPEHSVLEVGSPGVDRPLTAERHWRRAAHRLVAVTTLDGDSFTDRVDGVADGVVTFVSGRTEPLGNLREGRVQVEFSGGTDGH